MHRYVLHNCYQVTVDPDIEKQDMEGIKREITDYWTGRVEKFEALRLDELNSNMRRRWLDELHSWLPAGRALDILDIGTGTGFFCFLLAAEGHRMTGIDMTEEMIEGAKRTAARLELDARFLVMDGESPDFPPDSFDAIVTRNLTTFLPNLPEAYARWRDLLRVDGLLINFDADYYYDTSDAPLPENHAHMDLTEAQNAAYAHISEEMRALQRPRPMWDLELLNRAGFRNCRVDRDVYGRIYREIDRFYNPTPIFCITARK